MRRFQNICLVPLLVLVAVACSPNSERILEGPRQEVFPERDRAADVDQNRTAAVNLGRSTANSDWLQRGYDAAHTPPHAALSGAPSLVWSANIGEGPDRRHRITAEPVSARGQIFAMDSRSRVTAVNASGSVIWSVDLTPEGENPDDVSGGGLGVSGNVVFVTTGFGNLHALNVKDGSELWQQDLGAAATGAPTINGNFVYVSTRASQGWAIDKTSGRISWIVRGVPSRSGVVGGAAPAVGETLAVFPFASGQIFGVFKKGGLVRWQSSAVGARHGLAYADVVDVTGDPVIASGAIYIGNSAGRTVALDPATGDRRWTAGEGASGPLLVVGNAIFAISDRFQLVRLDAKSGKRIWAVDLPGAAVPNSWRGVQYNAQYGPVLAGGLLWVGSGSGQLNGFDAVSGALRHSVEVPEGAASRPIVVNNTLYIVNTAGQLLAFR